MTYNFAQAFRTPPGVGTSRQYFQDILEKNIGFLGCQEGNELLDPHPLAWRPPPNWTVSIAAGATVTGKNAHFGTLSFFLCEEMYAQWCAKVCTERVEIVKKLSLHTIQKIEGVIFLALVTHKQRPEYFG